MLRAAGDDAEPDDDGARSGRVFPVYPLTEKAKLTSARHRPATWGRPSTGPGRFADPLPEAGARRFGLVDRTTAFNHIHRPAPMADCEPARRRLAFDELFRLQLALVLRQDRLQRATPGASATWSSADDGSPTLVDRFLDGLPFAPTAAQRRAIAAIRDDLAGPLPMHRLLQGDVGSGKTVVAVAAMLVGGGGRPSGRADGPDRGAGRAARHRGPPACSTA